MTLKPLKVLFAGICLALVPASTFTFAEVATASPGDNGTVKTHNVGTAVSDRRDEPKVCEFYLDAFGFDGFQKVNYHFERGPAFKGPALLPGQITLDPAGDGHTGTLHLAPAQYKLFFLPVGAHGADKHKVFKVECDTPSPTPSATPSSTVSPTPVVTETPSATPSPTVSPTASPTASPAAPVKPTPTPTLLVFLNGPRRPLAGGSLPFTGANTLQLGLLGEALILAGFGALLVGRRT